MDLRKRKKNKGFTLIELMVVIVIIGILVAIALPNFIAAQDRAKLSSVKANMHTIQTVAETYAVDWGGVYAATLGDASKGDPDDGTTSEDGIAPEAKAKKYWKEFKNPFSGLEGVGKAYMKELTAAMDVDPATGDSTGHISGAVSYEGIKIGDAVTQYYIYGGAKEKDKVIVDKGAAFYLTNN